MSAVFYIEYGGAPLKLPELRVVDVSRATPFTSEAEAWLAAQKAGLSPLHLRVRQK